MDCLQVGSIKSECASQPCLRHGLLVCALALALNLAGNGRISLWDRDEPRYAACAREMRVSGDWVHPTFNGEPRYQKPVLIYWLMLATTAVAGDNPFGVRLVSALAGAATCVLVWRFGRRMFGPREGLLAGLILATAPLMVAESKLATTDATLTLLVVACQSVLWELSSRSSLRLAALFWLLIALAVLLKGPAGPALIAASGIVAWWWGGPAACWKRLRWRLGLCLFAAIVLPWLLLIHIRSDGEFFRVALGGQFVRRVVRGVEQHGGFPGYYVVFSLLSWFPWSAFVPSALAAAWGRRRESARFGFLLGWVFGPLIVLECVRTKLIHYYLPAFPAWALLVAWLVVAVADSGSELRSWTMGRFAGWILHGLSGLAAVGVGLAVGFAPVPVRWPCVCAMAVLAVGAVAARVRIRSGAVERAVYALAASLALSAVIIASWALPAAEPSRISSIVGHRLRALESEEQAPAVICSFQLPGVVYALGHPAPLIRSRHALANRAIDERAIVAALQPEELAAVGRDARVSIEVRESIRGLNLEKGRYDVIHLVVLRRREPLVSERALSSALR